MTHNEEERGPRFYTHPPDRRLAFASELTALRWSMETRKLKTKPYWSMPSRPLSRPEPLQALAREADELLRARVRSRLIADVPLGASGVQYPPRCLASAQRL